MSEFDRSAFERLLQRRIIALGTELDDNVAQAVIAQMLYLESLDRTRDITLYLSSPGGLVTSALAIHDVMMSLAPPIATIAIGNVAGGAALLLAAGRRGKRSALPGAQVGLLPLEAKVTPGNSRPSEITAREIRRLSAELRDLFSRHTRVDLATIEKTMKRATWMNAEQAKAFGLIDVIALPPAPW